MVMKNSSKLFTRNRKTFPSCCIIHKICTLKGISEPVYLKKLRVKKKERVAGEYTQGERKYLPPFLLLPKERERERERERLFRGRVTRVRCSNTTGIAKSRLEYYEYEEG
jgi:hypothetical protein